MTKQCNIAVSKSGKLWCTNHNQALMYVYSLKKLRARCQTGEDEDSELQDITHLFAFGNERGVEK